MTYPPLAIRVVLVLLVAAAGIYDLRYRRIPNWLTLSGLALGIALNGFLFETSGLLLSAKGLGLALLVYFPLYIVRGMGAGDVKLMAAVGALVGPWDWLGIFVITAVLGGLFAVILLLSKGKLRNTVANVAYLLTELAHFRPPYLKQEELDVRNPRAVTLPHGAVITIGSLAFLAAGAIWAPK